MSRFEEINIPDGVLSERLIDFEADNDGSLWMVTEEGLFLTDAKQRQTIHFGAGSGIERNIMNEGCLGKDNRYIWVGTYNSLMMAEKKQLHNDIASSYRPKLELDYVTTGEHSAGYGDMMRINDTRELSVKWNITIPRMVIMPVLTDYSKQGRDFYEYRLDDGRWNICPLGQAITMNNLTPENTHCRYAWPESRRTPFPIQSAPTLPHCFTQKYSSQQLWYCYCGGGTDGVVIPTYCCGNTYRPKTH